MKKFVPAYMPADGFTKLNGEATGMSDQFRPFFVSLTKDEKIGLRTMAEGREGYVRLVNRVANNNINSLPRDEDPMQLTAALAYYDQLMESRGKMLKTLEMLDDTASAVGVDMMGMADRYVNHLQTSRGNNTPLDMEMQEIDDFNKRFGARPNEEELPEEGEGLTPDQPEKQ